jgi:DNA-directed RNA polymerase II subunit RPB2
MTDSSFSKILESYFKKYGLVSQQIKSYNDFALNGIQQVIDETEPIVIENNSSRNDSSTKYEITFKKVYFNRPIINEKDGTKTPLFPNEARLRNLNYSAPLMCTINIKITRTKNDNGENTNDVIVENFTSDEVLGYIPIMVKSRLCSLSEKQDIDSYKYGECIYDEGAYFIINGGEKVIVSQEKMAHNIIFCSYKKYPRVIWSAEIRCQFDYELKIPQAVIVRLYSDNISENTGQEIETGSDPREIRIEIPYIRPDVPLFIVYKALGFNLEDSIKMLKQDIPNHSDQFIDEMIRPSIIEYKDICAEMSVEEMSIEDAQIYISKRGNVSQPTRAKDINYAMNILTNTLFFHIRSSTEGLFLKKAHFIGHIINKIFDHYVNLFQEVNRTSSYGSFQIKF